MNLYFGVLLGYSAVLILVGQIAAKRGNFCHVSRRQYRRGLDGRRERPGLPDRTFGLVVGGFGRDRNFDSFAERWAAAVANRQGARSAYAGRLSGISL